MLCGQLHSCMTAFPCRLCLVPGPELSNPVAWFPPKTSTLMETLLAPELAALRANAGGITEARKNAANLSVMLSENVLRKLPLGANPQGLNGACPPEMLHQYGLGIEKKAFHYAMEIVTRLGVMTNKVSSVAKHAFDHRFVTFNCRHSDVEMPKHRSRAGAYKLSFLSAKKYKALLYQVILQRASLY